MYQQYNLSLSKEDITNISLTLPLVSEKLDFLVRRFYYYILQTSASHLFYYTNMERQYMRFHSTIEILVSLLKEPKEFINQIDTLVIAHSHITIKDQYIDEFTTSLITSFQEIFHSFPECTLDTYSKLISELMTLFKNKIPLVDEK